MYMSRRRGCAVPERPSRVRLWTAGPLHGHRHRLLLQPRRRACRRSRWHSRCFLVVSCSCIGPLNMLGSSLLNRCSHADAAGWPTVNTPFYAFRKALLFCPLTLVGARRRHCGARGGRRCGSGHQPHAVARGHRRHLPATGAEVAPEAVASLVNIQWRCSARTPNLDRIVMFSSRCCS